MHRTIPTTLGLLVTLTVAGTTVVLAQDQDPTQEPTPSPMAIPAQGSLEPGTYASTALGPDVAFTIDTGDWAVAGRPIDGLGFGLGLSGPGGQFLDFTRFEGDVYAQPCFVPDEQLEGDSGVVAAERWLADPVNQAITEATAQGLWEHLEANPYLAVGEPAEVQIGGFTGLQFDLLATVPEECFDRDTQLWEQAGSAWFLSDSDQARVIALDMAGGALLITAESSAASGDYHEAFLERADALLKTVTITPDSEG